MLLGLPMFGLIGYLLIKFDLEPAPLLLGFVLGRLLEEKLRQAMAISQGSAWTFVEHRIAVMQDAGIAAFPEDGLGQFLRLSLLLALMTIATFIDFDEQTIPDAVTVPGTIAALALSAALPFSALDLVVETELQPLLLSSPLEWPAWLSAPEGLAIGIACQLLQLVVKKKWLLLLPPVVLLLVVKKKWLQ